MIDMGNDGDIPYILSFWLIVFLFHKLGFLPYLNRLWENFEKNGAPWHLRTKHAIMKIGYSVIPEEPLDET